MENRTQEDDLKAHLLATDENFRTPPSSMRN
jgi:hypothetical protein